MSLTYESSLFFILTLTAVSLGLFAWSRKPTTNALNTTWLMLTIALWTLALAMELQSPTLEAKLLWVRVQILAQVSIPALVFILVLTHTEQKTRLTAFSHIGLALMSVFTTVIASLRLSWIVSPSSGSVVTTGVRLHFEYGGWFWMLQLYAYLLFVYSALVLFMYIWRSPRPYREQTTSLLIALILPISGNLAYIFRFTSVNTTPFAAILSGGILTWNLTQYLLFDLIVSGRETLTDNMSEGFMVVDVKGRIQELNPSALRALGQSTATPGTKSLRDYPALEPLQAFLESRHPGETRLILDHPEGKRHYRTTITPLITRRGECSGQVIVLQDITPQEQAREALQNEERRYAELVERIPAGIFRTSANGDFLEVNSALAQIIGVAECHELLRRNANEFIFEEDAEIWGPLLTPGSKVIRNVETRLRHSHGSPVWVTLSVQAISDSTGQPLYYAGVVEDITAHRLMEMELRDSEQRSRAILQAFPDMMFVINKEGVCHDWFATDTSLLAAPASALIGRNLRDILPRQFAERVIARCQQVIDSGEMGIWEYPLAIGTGMHHFEARMVPYGDDKTLSVVRDITERKLTEERSRAYATRLQILHELDWAIIQAQPPDAVAKIGLQRIRELVPCLGCNIVLLKTQGTQGVVFAVSSDLEPPLIAEGTRITLRSPFLTEDVMQKLRDGENVRFTDAGSFLNQIPEIISGDKERIRTLLIVPLRTRKSLLGVINLIAAEEILTSEHSAVVQEIAASLAIAIHQAELREQAQHEAAAKTTLLEDVKHRVNGYFATILSLLLREESQARKLHQYWEQQQTDPREITRAYRTAITQLTQRVEGLATAHKMLSNTEWQPISLQALATEVIDTTLAALPDDQLVRLEITRSPVRVDAKSAGSLALILHELTTNSIKYALKQRSQGQIRVRISTKPTPDTDPGTKALTVCMEFHDDGSGYPEEVLQFKNVDVGLQLIQEMVLRDLRGNLSLHNDNGAVTRIYFRASEQAWAHQERIQVSFQQ